MSGQEEVTRILYLYREVCARQVHYHRQIWESARFFFWAFTLPMSASFFFYFDEAGSRDDPSFPFDLFSVGLVALAFWVAVWGKRVLLQERTMFAYELTVRQRIERALFCRIQHPQIVPLYYFRWLGKRGNAFGISYTDFECEAIPTSGVNFPDLRFRLEDQAAIRRAVFERKGVFGVFIRLFSCAMLFSITTLLVFSYGVAIRHDMLSFTIPVVQKVREAVSGEDFGEVVDKSVNQHIRRKSVDDERDDGKQRGTEAAAGIHEENPASVEVGTTTPLF